MNKIALIIIVVIFGGIAATIFAGVWSSESEKVPAVYKEGDFQGQYNPEDIRGSYYFDEVAELFEIDRDVLYKAFGLENLSDRNIKSKDLESLYINMENEIGNGSVQLFVALYKNLPISFEDTYLPEAAINIILEHNENLTEEVKEYLREHSAKIPVLNEDDLDVTLESQEDEEQEEEILVSGKTTIKDIQDAGITDEKIKEILGTDIPPSNTNIRDYCLEKGLSFSEIKEKINDLVP